MLRSTIGAGLLLAGSFTVAAAQDIAGTYTVTGKNPDGSDYSGVATIGGTAGGNCGITWTIGDGQTSQAFCMRQDDVLGAAYVIGESIGLVVYRLNAEGGLDGTWSIAGQEGVGEEHLTPQP
jgi:hypothetical protein